MADIIAQRDLEVWARQEIAPEDMDFARAVISAASLVVTEACGHPEWDRTTAPERAKLIASQVARRAFLNPDATVREQVGPLGTSTVEDFARTLELTPAEAAACAGMNDVAPGEGGELFFINLGGAVVAQDTTIYVPDESGTLFPWAETGDVGT